MKRIEKNIRAIDDRLGPDVHVGVVAHTYECRGGWDIDGWMVVAEREYEGEEAAVLAASGQDYEGPRIGRYVVDTGLTDVLEAASRYLDRIERETKRDALVARLFEDGDDT